MLVVDEERGKEREICHQTLWDIYIWVNIYGHIVHRQSVAQCLAHHMFHNHSSSSHDKHCNFISRAWMSRNAITSLLLPALTDTTAFMAQRFMEHPDLGCSSNTCSQFHLTLQTCTSASVSSFENIHHLHSTREQEDVKVQTSVIQ